MSYQTILFESKDKIATITLNKPEKLNAFSRGMLDALFLEKRKPNWKMSVPQDLPNFFPLN